MKVTNEKSAPGEVTLRIEVEAERVQEAMKRTARELSRRTVIPGFRPGKAPYHLIERYLGKEYLLGRAIESIGSQIYQEALTEAGIEPYAEGNLDVEQQEPLILKAVVPVQPVVTLGDYRSVRVEKKEPRFTEQDVDSALEQLREQHAEWVPVDRPIQDGDQVTIDLEGQVGEETLLNQTSRRTQVSANMFPQGLYEKLIGAKAGQTLDYTVSYPQDSSIEQFAGKTVNFHLEILQVGEKRLPPLDDTLPKVLSSDETLEQLRTRIHDQLVGQESAAMHNELRTKILDAILERSTLEYPAIAVEKEIDRQMQDMKQQVAQQGLTWEGYLNMSGKTEAELREDVRPFAETILRHSLVLREVAKIEGIEASDEEVETEIQRVSQSFGEQAEAVKNMLSEPASRAAIAARMRLSKAADRLIAMATSETEKDAEPPAQETVEATTLEKPEENRQPPAEAA